MRDREEAEQRVGQRVLAEHRAARARPSAGRTRRRRRRRRGAAGARSRTPAPARAKSGIRGMRPSGTHVEREGDQQREPDESGLTGSSSWSAPRGMIIGVPLAAVASARGRAPFGAARRLGRARGAASGRGGICRPTGSSTSTWRTPSARRQRREQRCARSRSRRCGRRVATLRDRQARRVDAVDAGGGEHVADLHVGVAGHEAQFEQPPSAGGRRTPRCARRCALFSTGIAASGRSAA